MSSAVRHVPRTLSLVDIPETKGRSMNHRSVWFRTLFKTILVMVLAVFIPAALVRAAAHPTPQAAMPGAAAPLSTSLGSVLLVVGSTSPLSASDLAVQDRLIALNYTVIVKTHSLATTADATGKVLVIISSSVSSGTVGNKYASVTVPVLLWENGLYATMGMTGSTLGTDYGVTASTTDTSIASPGHPLAAGLTGTTPIVNQSMALVFGKPSSAATKVSMYPSSSSKAMIFAYETGAAMVTGTAPARRVGFFFNDTSPASATTQGWSLFDATVGWAATPAAAVPTATPSPTPLPLPQGTVVARINAGATAATTVNGVTWAADSMYTGGYLWENTAIQDIANTADDALYRTKHGPFCTLPQKLAANI
jgi:hypothetical protein